MRIAIPQQKAATGSRFFPATSARSKSFYPPSGHHRHHRSEPEPGIPIPVTISPCSARRAASSGETLNNEPRDAASRRGASRRSNVQARPSGVPRFYIEASRRLRGFPQRSAGWKRRMDGVQAEQRKPEASPLIEERYASAGKRCGRGIGTETERVARIHRLSAATSWIAWSAVTHVFGSVRSCP